MVAGRPWASRSRNAPLWTPCGRTWPRPCTTSRACQIMRRRHASASHRRDPSPPNQTQRYTETQDPTGCILFLLPCVHVLLRACSAAPACLLRCFPRAPGARRCSLPSSCVMAMKLPCTLGCMPPPVLCCSHISLPGGTHHMHGGTHPCMGAAIHAPVERLRSQHLSGFASQHPPYHPG